MGHLEGLALAGEARIAASRPTVPGGHLRRGRGRISPGERGRPPRSLSLRASSTRRESPSPGEPARHSTTPLLQSWARCGDSHGYRMCETNPICSTARALRKAGLGTQQGSNCAKQTQSAGTGMCDKCRVGKQL
jgi:hypothetical protein